jgi:hypothetical protein
MTDTQKPFQVRFVDVESRVEMELLNISNQSFKSVEILTVFLKDESTHGGPSSAHIRFDTLGAMSPNSQVTMSHKTWTNGHAVDGKEDQLGRLKPVTGTTKPYVLDISWEDAAGRTWYQRIPVGH